MTKRVVIELDLPEAVAEALDAAVAEGRFGSSSALVVALLDGWAAGRAEPTGDAEIALLRAAWDEGIESGPALDFDEVFSGFRAKYGA